MPETLAQWIWFTFWFGGSLGGWWVVYIVGGEAVTRLKYLRARKNG